MKTGVYILGQNSPMVIRGAIFHNLHYGLHLVNSFAQVDSVAYCQFNDCITGIYTLSVCNAGTISNCRFTEGPSDSKMIGINMELSSPTVLNCEFLNLKGSGILSRQSIYIQQAGISGCHFTNCGSFVDGSFLGGAIESYNATGGVKNSHFNLNEIGLLCHAGSNLKLLDDASNILNNRSWNVFFTDTQPYQAYIQLTYGHNDFHHYTNPSTGQTTCDFNFDGNYLNGYELIPINADGNWFQDNIIRISPESADNHHYVQCEEWDPSPNIPREPIEENRYFTALQYESDGLSGEAYDLYKYILNEPEDDEKEYLGSCADGIFRISVDKHYQVNEEVNYFDTMVLQYATSEPYLSKLLQTYLLKEFIVGEDFQSAIDLIQPRIDNPISELDSLRTVFDIELILQVAALVENKRPLTCAYPQYKYADVSTYSEKHENNWNKMIALLNKNETDAYPIPPITTLYDNYPNPFNPSTTISFAIPKETPVKIRLYNIKGQMVKQLCNETMKKGMHRLVWDGLNEQGRAAGSGLYLIRLETKDKVITKKAMMLK